MKNFWKAIKWPAIFYGLVFIGAAAYWGFYYYSKVAKAETVKVEVHEQTKEELVEAYKPMKIVDGQGGLEYQRFWEEVERMNAHCLVYSEMTYLDIWLERPNKKYGKNGIRRDLAYQNKDVYEYVSCLKEMDAEYMKCAQFNKDGNTIVFAPDGKVYRQTNYDQPLFEVNTY